MSATKINGHHINGNKPHKPVVSLFKHKQVIVQPAYEISSSGYFVRNKQRIYRLIAELLSEARKSRFGKRIQEEFIVKTIPYIDKLCKELDGSTPALRVLDVVRWYADLPWRTKFQGEEYIPWVEGGPSLYDKFIRLEQQMLNRTKQIHTTFPVDAVEDLFVDEPNAGKRAADFVDQVLGPAKGMQLGGVEGDSHLAALLAKLYLRIREIRKNSHMPAITIHQLGGPLGLVQQYVEWVKDQHWMATIKVLDFDSPAFSQFRRESAQYDVEQRDPVTGESWWR